MAGEGYNPNRGQDGKFTSGGGGGSSGMSTDELKMRAAASDESTKALGFNRPGLTGTMNAPPKKERNDTGRKYPNGTPIRVGDKVKVRMSEQRGKTWIARTVNARVVGRAVHVRDVRVKTPDGREFEHPMEYIDKRVL